MKKRSITRCFTPWLYSLWGWCSISIKRLPSPLQGGDFSSGSFSFRGVFISWRSRGIKWLGAITPLGGVAFLIGFGSGWYGPSSKVTCNLYLTKMEHQKKFKIFCFQKFIGGWMKEQHGLITMMGQSLTLIGNEVKVGEKAHWFYGPWQCSGSGSIFYPTGGKNLYPLLCSISRHRQFVIPKQGDSNEEASRLRPDILILTHQHGFTLCARNDGVPQPVWIRSRPYRTIAMLSFGTSFGVLIKELRLLARAVFLIDRQGTIQYIQLVKELTKEPDYEAILGALKKLAWKEVKGWKKILMSLTAMISYSSAFIFPAMAATNHRKRENSCQSINLPIPKKSRGEKLLGLSGSGSFKIPQIKAKVVIIWNF